MKVLTKPKVIERLDLSDSFWEQHGVQNKNLRKQVGLYEVENIENANILTIAINPKEYFEKYKDFNKKHKGLKKNTPGMDFETYMERLATLHKYCFESKPKKIKQKRFQLINDSMQMKSVKKTQVAALNDKRCYFHDGIVSFTFGHFLLNKSREEKEKYRLQLHTNIPEKMFEFLAQESHAVHLCERLRVLGPIYAQPPLLYLLNS